MLRTLFERSELVRFPQIRVRPILIWPTWASVALGPFAKTKGPRLPGRDPASQKIIEIRDEVLVAGLTLLDRLSQEMTPNATDTGMTAP